MIIDHILFSVSDYEVSKKFYSGTLAPLGIELVMELQGWAGFGKNGKPEFWFGVDENPHSPMHIALCAENHKQVDQFYQAAMSAGGKDNGEPGIRGHYHPNYYGAYIIDPDGHNIEAVCHSAMD